MKRIAIALSGVLLLTSCGTLKITPTTVHIDADTHQLAHDETISAQGVTDYYPDKAAPQETLFTGQNGLLVDTTCKNANCSHVLVKVSNSPLYPNGAYVVLQTDDPNLMMVQDAQGVRTVGYAARNHRGAWSLLPDLQQAQVYEQKGHTARTVGKVVLGILIVGAVVGVVAAAAAVDANANAVTTRCFSFGNSTTCTTR